MLLFPHATTAGRANRKDCAAAILYAAENATRAALNSIQLLGGNGCVHLRRCCLALSADAAWLQASRLHSLARRGAGMPCGALRCNSRAH